MKHWKMQQTKLIGKKKNNGEKIEIKKKNQQKKIAKGEGEEGVN